MKRIVFESGVFIQAEIGLKGIILCLEKIERDVTILFVIGLNSDQTKMKEMGFNASTGEYIKPNGYEGFRLI